MDLFTLFRNHAALCASMLMLFSTHASADNIQNINQLLRQGKSSEALERVNAYLSDKPKDAQGRFQKGLILTEQGKTSDAIRVFTDLTVDYPELPEPHNNLAVLYASQGQYDKARAALEMAIRTHPSYATAHENLGDIYAKMASQAYDRALQLDRANSTTQTKLSLIKDLFTTSTASRDNKSNTPVAEPVATAQDTPITEPVKIASPATPPAAVAQAPVAARQSGANSRQEVLLAIQKWAAAWSAQNAPEYLSFYANNFVVPDGMTRAAWEQQRKERITKPASIQVGLSNIKVRLIDATRASVSFKQSYRASHLRSTSDKILMLVNSGDGWKIQEERSSN